MLGGRETYRGAVTLGERATDRKKGCWGTDPGVVGPEGIQNRPERRGCLGDAEPTGSRVRALNRADSQPLTCAWATTRLLLPSPWYPHSFSSIFPSSIPRCGPGASRGHELGAAGSPRHQPQPTGEELLSAAASARPSRPHSQALAAGSHAPDISHGRAGQLPGLRPLLLC